MSKERTTTRPQKRAHEIVQPPPKPWTARGREDAYFQREAQVNWWTVLGGITVAALLTQGSAVLDGLNAGRWWLALYFSASALIIITSWVQTAWGSLVLKWPITVPGALIIFLGNLTLAVQCLQVTNPQVWMTASGLVVLFAVLIQLYFNMSGAWVGFPPQLVAQIKIQQLWVNSSFMLIAFIGALLLHFYPSATMEIGWGIFALLASSAALIMQHFGMERERRVLGIP